MTNGESLDIKSDRLKKLKELFPELFSENQVDWEKLKAAFGDDINFSNERYVLNWAGKSDAFKVLQISTTATLKPILGESVNFDTTENVFIEGENLEVLKVLQKSYYNKVKCIIIDPPYNTGSDSFIYPDKFSEKKEDYLKRIGDKDEEGYLMKEGLFRKNSKDSGHYHSNWLNMMYPRLFLAKNLLRDDGVIFVHIDDNEVHNLRIVMNEIFGEENFIAELVWEKKKKGAFLSGKYTNIKEYILVYCKNEKSFSGLIGEINDDLGTYPCINETNNREIRTIPAGIKSKFKEKNYFLKKGSKISVTTMDLILHSDLVIKEGILAEELIIEGNWRYSQDAMEEFAEADELYITEDLYLRRIVTHPRYKKLKDILPKEAKDQESKINLKNLFSTGWGTNEDAKEEIRLLTGVKNLMDYPKPVILLLKLMVSIRENDFIVMDFFAGSGTLAQAVYELNSQDGGKRKFICVQLAENTPKNSNAYKAGYTTIADVAKTRMKKAIDKINNEKKDLFSPEISNLDLGFKVFKLSQSNFKIWRSDEITEENLVQQLDVFTKPVNEGADKTNILYELMLKAGYKLTDIVEYTNNYYSVNGGELIILLDTITDKIIEQIITSKPKKVITLDSLFTNNDQLKTNTVLQMRDAKIDFKTI